MGANNLKHAVRFCCCLSATVGMALLASRTQAQITRVGNAYQFRVRYHKGMKINYLTKITISPPATTPGGKAQAMVMAMPLVGNVTDVQNKIATVQVTTGPSTLNGQPQGTAQTLTLKLDDRGKTVGGAPSGMENIMTPPPDKMLKVGDTYSTKLALTIMQIPLTTTATYKFMGVKSVGGHQVATFAMTINGTGSIPNPQGATAHLTMKGTGLMLRSADDGLITHTSIDQEVTAPQGTQTLRLKTKTVIERQ